MKQLLKTYYFTIVLLFVGFSALAQDMTSTTQVSPRASITQRIGSTDVTIVYHSPTAKGRKIFGGIVPYDFVVDGKEYAWRAGSNQRTTFDFAHDVTINGQKLAAGSYGFVILVSKKEWTLIFSSDKSWGAFQYNKENDVLRVPVKTESVRHQEWLSYNFINRTASSSSVEIRWEKIRVVFDIATDVTANILSDLQKKEDKGTRDYRTIAEQLLKQDPSKQKEALDWVEKSLSVIDDVEERFRDTERFNSNIMKADLLIALGETERGSELRKETMATAKGFNMYYYGLSPILLRGEQEKSLQLLTDYVNKKPEDWIAHLALGEYYLKVGNQKKVVEHFKKASEYAVPNWKNYAHYLYLQNKLVLDN